MSYLSREALNEILRTLSSVKVGLIGDGCVDIYWEADMRRSELSREVPHYPLPVVNERFSLGAAANVVANLTALGVRNIRYIGLAGEDWRKTLFVELLDQIGVSCEDLIVTPGRVTPAYCKPIRCGISDVRYEDPRIDFANHSPISAETEDRLLERLDAVASQCDILLVCDQLDFGCMTDRLITRVNEWGVRMPVIVDSRNQGAKYRNVILKPNEVEACRMLARDPGDAQNMEKMQDAAKELSGVTGRPVLLTLGARGAIWHDANTCCHIPAFPVLPPIDFVGAGDAFLAGFAAAYAAKAELPAAMTFASLTAAVTIKKIGITGTASPTELRETFALYI